MKKYRIYLEFIDVRDKSKVVRIYWNHILQRWFNNREHASSFVDKEERLLPFNAKWEEYTDLG